MPAKAAPRPTPALSLGAPLPEWEGIGLSGEARKAFFDPAWGYAVKGVSWEQEFEAHFAAEPPKGGYLDGPYFSSGAPVAMWTCAWRGRAVKAYGQLTLMEREGPAASAKALRRLLAGID